jgi:hypothetical protein
MINSIPAAAVAKVAAWFSHMALPALGDIFSQFAVEQDTGAISCQIADLILA